MCKLQVLFVYKYILLGQHNYRMRRQIYEKLHFIFHIKKLITGVLKIMSAKKDSLSIWTVIGLIAAVAAVVASVTTALIVIKKKEKEDRELEEYLDYSIQ